MEDSVIDTFEVSYEQKFFSYAVTIVTMELLLTIRNDDQT
jgi:DNA-directed RNA polymerase specialized sigma subunit